MIIQSIDICVNVPPDLVELTIPVRALQGISREKVYSVAAAVLLLGVKASTSMI